MQEMNLMLLAVLALAWQSNVPNATHQKLQDSTACSALAEQEIRESELLILTRPQGGFFFSASAVVYDQRTPTMFLLVARRRGPSFIAKTVFRPFSCTENSLQSEQLKRSPEQTTELVDISLTMAFELTRELAKVLESSIARQRQYFNSSSYKESLPLPDATTYRFVLSGANRFELTTIGPPFERVGTTETNSVFGWLRNVRAKFDQRIKHPLPARK